MIKPWTSQEITIVKHYGPLGSSLLAALLDRSIDSIESKAKELRISLVIANDDVDVSELVDRILTRIKEAPELQLCPMCGKRLATMRATGMCRCCHLDQLIALREEQLAEEIRVRKLTKLRQDKRRLRICDDCSQAFFPRLTSDSTRCPDCGGSE